MSIEYCHKCDRHIDTDFNAEHFYEDEDTGLLECEMEKQGDLEELDKDNQLDR